MGGWIKRCRDAEKSGTMSHKELADYLYKAFDLSFWWAQTIVVEFEKCTGRWVLGETKDSGFQVGVSRTLNCSAEEGWRRIHSQKGQSLWLDGDIMITPRKGEVFDGRQVWGEIRIWKPKSHIRLTRQERDSF